MKKILLSCALSSGLLLASPAGLAQENVQPRQNGESFSNWLVAFKEDARKAGISDRTLEIVFKDFEPIERVLELDQRQPEFTRTFWGYLDRAVNDNRINKAREMMRTHKVLLDEISRKYGVQSRFLVAFWGLETDFGRFMGGFPVIGALATLAHDPRRDDFFRAELMEALRIVDNGDIALADMEGSWAGAMGHVQFMPSTFAAYAVDENGNGRKDIWKDLPDAFGSAANYLSSLGWNADYTWGREVKVPADFDWTLASLSVRKGLAEWQELGLRKAVGGNLPSVDLAASLVLPMGHKGPAFLVYENYRKILNWNRSTLYALAVGHLADRIEGRGRFLTPRPARVQPLSRDNAVEIQNHLNRLGYDVGKADGILGSNTRRGVRAFQVKAGLPGDGYADYDLLQILRDYKHQ
ncbi:lytic murein transglycosylase [Kiloniella sp. b19]|uniref:lytic murein transglycosylase n=1 Tax=Kiloniella sp. GXU_MW_B19 TaxID=3141326 RepID=UPI0031D9BAF5